MSAIESVIAAAGSNIEAADVATADWSEEAEAAVAEFEQPYISYVIGWQLEGIG
jgi:hypothetical protein